MAPDPADPAAILARIKERAKAAADFPLAEFAKLIDHDTKTVGGWISASALDVPPLVDALEAVLKLHRPVDDGAGAQCKGCATHVTFTRWPCATYRAITRELTGKEAGDGE